MTPLKPPAGPRDERPPRWLERVWGVGSAALSAATGRRYRGATTRELLLIARVLWHGRVGPGGEPPLFDRVSYLEACPHSAATGLDPFVHFLRHGAAAKIDPHPLLSADYYLWRYPEVGASGLNPLVHFVLYGGAERRDPHPLFSTAFYLASHSGVARSGLNPLHHFIAFGSARGYLPHPLFDTRYYIECYPDVVASGLNPLVHFLRYGAARRLNPHPLFDSDFYLSRYPDVVATGLNPLVHFVRYGALEGRDPHPLFDSVFYRHRHPEIVASGENPLLHFLTQGARDSPHPLFDVAYYTEGGEIPDGSNPLVHYLSQGAMEGRNPHPLFVTDYYGGRNPDVGRAGLNPLVHYIRFGAREGRRPHPLFDPAFYWRQGPGVRDEPTVNPVVDFLDRGVRDGCSPHPLFDLRHYTSRQESAVREAENPLVHFLREGAAAGLASVTAESVGMTRRRHLRTAPTVEYGGGPLGRVGVVGIGPILEPATGWADRVVSTAEPVAVTVEARSLPLAFPACAEGVNSAAAKAGADFLFLVSGRLEPDRNWLQPLLHAFALFPRAGAVCSEVQPRPAANEDSASAGRAGGGAVCAVRQLSPGGFLIPRELFLRLGGLDSTASSYVDSVGMLSERLRVHGFEVYSHPHSRLVGGARPHEAPVVSRGDRTLFAAVAGGPPENAVARADDVVVAALRVLAACGWHVVVWPIDWTEGAPDGGARAWQALGLEVAIGSGRRPPAPFLALRADAVLLDQAIDRTTFAQLLAIQPQARFVMVVEREEAVDQCALEQCDAVISQDGGPGTVNCLDLSSILSAPGEHDAAGNRGRVYCLGSGTTTAALREALGERFSGVEVASGLPASATGAQDVLAVVALEAERSLETEALRSALAQDIPVIAAPQVAALAGTAEIAALGAQDSRNELVRSLTTAFPTLGISGTLVGPRGSDARRRWPWTVAERPLTRLFRRAGIRSSEARSAQLEGRARDLASSGATVADVVLLGMIDWHYRHQRPQHLSIELGRRARRVFYVEPEFRGGLDPAPYRLEENPEENVFCVTLGLSSPVDIHGRSPTGTQVEAIAASLRALFGAVEVDHPILVLEAPFWQPVGQLVPRAQLVYDCMDLYRAFDNARQELVELEMDLLGSADLVVFTASALRDRLPVGRRSRIIRNACEFGRFASATGHRMSDRITVGYVGAVDHWFDVDLISRCVQSRPGWDFVLAGSRAGLRDESLLRRPNLRLLDEVDYAEVPGLVAAFDVCLVPFIENELTACVNPVKVYEYLAAGKPVVATPLPELRLLPSGLLHLASSGRAFLTALDRAVDERKDAVLANQRRQWASGQTWSARADEFLKALVE